MFEHKTNKGRVVYNRKKHTFNYCDSLRVLKRISVSTDKWIDDRELICLLDVLSLTTLIIENLTAEFLAAAAAANPAVNEAGSYAVKRIVEFAGFSGGTFAGAGATREF